MKRDNTPTLELSIIAPLELCFAVSSLHSIKVTGALGEPKLGELKEVQLQANKLGRD